MNYDNAMMGEFMELISEGTFSQDRSLGIPASGTSYASRTAALDARLEAVRVEIAAIAAAARSLGPAPTAR